jgi:hypothetical protein
MAQTITSQVGGETKERWLAETVAITAGTLSPAISQAADLWGRKWLVVGFTVAGAVGCLIVSRADNFGTLIAGQCIPHHSIRAKQVLIDSQRSELFRPEFNASSMPSHQKSCHGNGEQ